MHFIEYNRAEALEYAKRWAMKRNPEYYNFDGLGGDCTNFASQCLYAGCRVMNFEREYGWYYISPDNRAPAWSGCEFFKRFMLSNRGEGPFGIAREIHQLDEGDYILLNNGIEYYHTLIVVGFDGSIPLVAAHTFDAYKVRLDSYRYQGAFGLHIIGANFFSDRGPSPV